MQLSPAYKRTHSAHNYFSPFPTLSNSLCYACMHVYVCVHLCVFLFKYSSLHYHIPDRCTWISVNIILIQRSLCYSSVCIFTEDPIKGSQKKVLLVSKKEGWVNIQNLCMLGLVPKKTHKTLRIIIALGRGQEKPRIIDEKRTFFLPSDFLFLVPFWLFIRNKYYLKTLHKEGKDY